MTIDKKTKAWLVDTAERVGSTVVEAGLAYLTTRLASLPAIYVVLLTPGLAALKAQVAKLIPADSVSPASFAPAQQPGQAEQDAPPPDDSAVFLTAPHRLKLLPKPSGRKGGALPSPRDERDYQAKLPRLSSIPASIDYGVGISWSMLLNDRIGDCYPVALLHALQLLTGYTPIDADALAIYEQVTGYDPHRTDANGDNPTDQGTYGRQLFDWARSKGLIKSYAAVPVSRDAVKAAIAAHKAVLCEWALPVGAEREGDVWTMPRTGRAAGSWGGHATAEVGYTTRRNRNVTWGQEGTVTPPFEDAYLVAAWVVEVAPGADISAIMAKVRAM